MVPWLQTFTGKKFYPLNPTFDSICIEDIAHGLSLQCRFNGACSEFYSVAEHSVRVSLVLPKKWALWGLLHDAAEAYLGDLVSPIKYQPEAEWFRTIEDSLMEAIAVKYDLAWPMPNKVKRVDCILLATEARDLMVNPILWSITEKPLKGRIEPLSARKAERAFLNRYNVLTRGVQK